MSMSMLKKAVRHSPSTKRCEKQQTHTKGNAGCANGNDKLTRQQHTQYSWNPNTKSDDQTTNKYQACRPAHARRTHAAPCLVCMCHLWLRYSIDPACTVQARKLYDQSPVPWVMYVCHLALGTSLYILSLRAATTTICAARWPHARACSNVPGPALTRSGFYANPRPPPRLPRLHLSCLCPVGWPWGFAATPPPSLPHLDIQRPRSRVREWVAA